MELVILAFEQDLSRFVKHIKTKKNGELQSGFAEKHISKQAKSHSSLWNLWNTYESRLNKVYFEEKLLIIGEFLYSSREYHLATNYCFLKFLQKFGIEEAPYNMMMKEMAISKFKEIYFPVGSEDGQAVKTIRTLLGISIAHCHEILAYDPKIKNKMTLNHLLNCLKVIQLTTQVALENEVLCWLVYNGTIHIYTVGRLLLTNGYGRQALEYLLWACVCMESSVPLMTTRYLTWRCQLYTAVCHCYYDINAAFEAETFAKRCLNLVQELQEIDEKSTSESNEQIQEIFAGASLRMKVMIFKRNVYESRRRPKGILRPKNKPPLKELTTNPWPRTTTERMLGDTFRGRAAQMLAVIEALSDSKRRIIQTSIGAPESDDSILDVYGELFFAGCELVAGGGGVRPPSPGKHDFPIGDAVEDVQLMEMAVKGEDTISYSSLVQFVQLAYNFEAWDAFEYLIQPVISLLKPIMHSDKHLIEVKSLEILQAMLPVNLSRTKKKVTLGTEEKDTSELVSTKQSNARPSSFLDDFLNLVDVIESCVTGDKSNVIMAGLTDMLVDSCFFLWSKCKSHFSRVSSLAADTYKAVLQDVNLEKWLRALVVTQDAMIQVGIAEIDACACAEASIKLALLIEFFCSDVQQVGDGSRKRLKAREESANQEANERYPDARSRLNAVASQTGCAANAWELLLFAKRRLLRAIKSIDEFKSSHFDVDGKVADDSLTKDIAKDSKITNGSSVQRDADAMHLELIYIHHRIDCKLNQMKSDIKDDKKTRKVAENLGIVPCAGKNLLLKAVYLICKAETNDVSNREENHQLLVESSELLSKAVVAENKLAKNKNSSNKCLDQNIPPAPNLVFRSATTMTFKPAEFSPGGNGQVKWYRLFARSASGNSVKVRLTDTHLPGSGIEVPNDNNILLKVTGLTTNEKYVVAVAAYNKKGQLIGDTIGHTSKPILASTPLPICIGYGYLAKISYNVGAWDIAKNAFRILWNHFVIDSSFIQQETDVSSARESTELRLHQLNMEAIERASVILIRYLLQTVFISVDMRIREGALFCNSLCDFKPPYTGQNARLEECKKLLIAMDIAGLINDSSLCLQAVIQCYGLLAPFLQFEIHVKPALQVLIKCFAALQELHHLIKQRKLSNLSENLQHMVSAITFYLARMLEKQRQRYGAIRILECNNKILVGDATIAPPDSASTSNFTAFGSGAGLQKKLTKKGTLKKMKVAMGKSGMRGMTELTGSENIAVELKTLEAYLLRLKKEGEINHDDEAMDLTGSEEAPRVYAVLTRLSPEAAYREVSKFKRRAQYLEHFVLVLNKALNEGLHSVMVEWSRDAVAWLTRRNEVLLNKHPPDNRGGTVIVPAEEEKTRKFSTALVEYGKASQIPSNRELLPIAESPRQPSKKESDAKSGPKHGVKKVRSKKAAQLSDDEKNLKDATQKLQDLLPEFFKTVHRRRRLRHVTSEELPWRAQMNLLLSRCYFDMSSDKFKAIVKSHGLIEDSQNSDLMDPSWFSLATSEALIVSWAGWPQKSVHDIEPTIDIGGQSIEHTDRTASSLQIDHISGKGKIVLKSRASHMRKTSRSNLNDGGSQTIEDPVKAYIAHIKSTLMYLKRSMVLARRGRNWVLLQNAARELYNISNTLHKRVMSLTSIDVIKNAQSYPIDIAKIRNLLWSPFYIAADCLLDMMNYIFWDGADKSEFKTTLEPTSEMTFNGNINEYAGGSSMHFDKTMDDSSTTSMAWLKKITWYAIEILYYKEKWEKIVDLIYRFSALTRDRFGESLLPIMVFSQRQIHHRFESLSGPPKEQPQVVFDKDTGIPLAAYLDAPDVVSIEAGAHIDPEGHNLYKPSLDGLALACVSLNIQENMERLHQVLNLKQYSARAMEHCRRLMMMYLAGKQNGLSSKAKLRLGSRVSFIASQVRPQAAAPPDLYPETFEDKEDVENFPLQESQLAVVISAYDKAIEMLKYRQEPGLASQAMHELGNIMMHSGKMRFAYKLWAETLDTLLQTKDALQSWRKFVSKKHSIHSTKALLDRCGIWGCLLAAVLASKIARYIHTLDLGIRTEFCQLSAAMFQALLCSSLPHPSAFIDYANYDIGVQHNVKELIPGVDLFSDAFRADCNTVIAALFWTANEMIRAGFLLRVLPLLSICQYFAVDVCCDVKKAVEVKLLRVRALTGMNLFAEAIKHLEDVFTGKDMPCLSLNKLKSSIPIQKFGTFDNSKKLTDNCNYKVIRELACANLINETTEAIGSRLAQKVEVTQAYLLNAVAKTITALPEDVTPPGSPSFLKEENLDVKRSGSKLKKSSSKVALPQKKKAIRSKGGSPAVTPRIDAGNEEMQTPSKIKGLLLSSAEKILQRTLFRANGAENKDLHLLKKPAVSAENLEMICQCKTELANVAEMRLLSITAARHIFNAMKLIDIASEMEDAEETDDYPKMSCISNKSHADTSIVHSSPDVNIDARLWLSLRLQIAKHLSECVKIPVIDQPLEAEALIGSAAYHIEQGLKEADGLNDKEVLCKFVMLGIMNSMRTGEDIENIVERLKDLDKELTSMATLSFELNRMIIDCRILCTDLQAVSESLSAADAYSAFIGILDTMLSQIVLLGNDAIPKCQTLSNPIANIYHPMLTTFVAVKLRLSRCKANSIEGAANDVESLIKAWYSVSEIIEDAMDLQQKLAMETPFIEMELAFIKGLLTRQLFELEKMDMKETLQMLIEAVKVSTRHLQDLSIIRQIYQEIALVFMTVLNRTEAVFLKADKQRRLEEGEKEKDRVASPGKSSSTSTSSLSRQAQQQQKALQAKRDKEARLREKQRQSIRRAAWVAIRTAGAIAKAQKKFESLTTDDIAVSDEMKELTAPDFCLYEILKTDAVVVDKETGSSINDGIVRTQNRFGKTDFFQFTWQHVINYARTLKRQTGYTGMGLGSGSKLSVRAAFGSERTALKMEMIHNFLRESLVIYDKECCPVLPMDFFLNLPFTSTATQPVPSINVVPDREEADTKKTDRPEPSEVVAEMSPRSSTPREENTPNVTAVVKESTERPKSVPSEKVPDKSDRIHARDPLQASDLEVAVQWYRPELSPDSSTIFLFAMNNKGVSIADKPTSFAAFVTVNQIRVKVPEELHHDLTELFHTAESELNQQSVTFGKTSAVVQAASLMSVSPTRKKKSVGIKAISVEQDKEDQLRVTLKGILDRLHNSFKKDSVSEVPFDVTFQNIACLEKLFNPNFGHISKTTEAFFMWLSRLLN